MQAGDAVVVEGPRATYKAEVLDTREDGGETQVKVHFHGFHARLDQWVSQDRVQPVPTNAADRGSPSSGVGGGADGDSKKPPSPPTIAFVHPLTRGEIVFGLTAIINAHRLGEASSSEKGALKSFFLQHARLINSIFLETQDEYGPHPRLFMAVIRHLKDGTPVAQTLDGDGPASAEPSDDGRTKRRRRRRRGPRNAGQAGTESTAPPVQLPPHPRQLEKQQRARSLQHVRLFQHLLSLYPPEDVAKPEFGCLDPVPLRSGPRMSIADNVGVIKAASAKSIALMKAGRRVIVVGETLDQAVAGSLFLEPDGANFCFVSDDDPSNGVVQMFLVGGRTPPARPRESASEITESVSQFRFITLTEADSITWIIGITTVVAALASKEDKLAAQPRNRTVWQAARAQLLALTPHVGIAPACASVLDAVAKECKALRDTSEAAAAGGGEALTCWLPFTMHRPASSTEE